MLPMEHSAEVGLNILQLLYARPKANWDLKMLMLELKETEVVTYTAIRELREFGYVTGVTGCYSITEGIEHTTLKRYLEVFDKRWAAIGPFSTYLASERANNTVMAFLHTVKLKYLFEGHKPLFRIKIAEAA